MSHSVRKHLRLDVEAYDSRIRQFIPGYEDMVETAVGVVLAADPSHVLDLGAGTGALAGALLERSPESAVVELLDIDPEMMDQARARLGVFGDRVRYSLRSFAEPLPACDAAMASLSLHHVPTIEAKRALFGRIHDALRPGGVFVNADVTMPADEPARSDAYERWADHLVASRIRRADAFDHFRAWSDEDTYFPLEDELAALGDAGFRAECVWRESVSTVVVAYSQTTP